MTRGILTARGARREERRLAGRDQRLSFIPVHQEAYELCVADAQIDDPRIAALLGTPQSAAASRQLIADVPGCTAAETGSIRIAA